MDYFSGTLVVLRFFLFMMEVFNAVSHAFVGLGLRLLPFKDMVQLRSYFVFSILTLSTTILVVDIPYIVPALLVMCHHFFCYSTWNESNYSRKLILWSSLNWTGSRLKAPFLFIGSLSVAAVHGHHGYLLGTTISFNEIVMGLVLTQCVLMSIMYNRRLAWATPANIPEWIQKRIDSSILPAHIQDSVEPLSSKARSKKRN